MAGAYDDDKIVLRVLVVNGNAFQRRLMSEMLRAYGRVDISYAENAEQCMLALSYVQPDLLVTDWQLEGLDGLALVRRVRAGEAGEGLKRLPVILIGEKTRPSDLERARAGGIDEFVLRPFSTATLVERVAEVCERRREFIESPRYVGPCRRRTRGQGYDGPRRRLFDVSNREADAPDVQIRKGLARMYVERISTLLAGATPANRDSMRDLCLACGQLSALAGDMQDRLLMSATSSLFNYVKAVSADVEMHRDVVQAHLDSIVQLAELPNFQTELRQTVTQQLTLMVTKKLRQAGQAA